VTLEHARALGCREARVLTENDKFAALALYAKCGGVRSETYRVMVTFRLTDGR
jgi:hypothetical protein